MTERPICPKVHKHNHGGSSTCYWYGCRCTPCSEYVTERQFYYRNMRRLGRHNPRVRIDATGTHRRLQALEVLGWSATHIARELGMSGARMRQINNAAHLSPENVEKIEAIYDRLWATQAPHGVGPNRTRNRARLNNWAPPLAWDDDTIDDPNARPYSTTDDEPDIDEIAVALSVRGEKAKLRPAERRLVVPPLHALRWSDAKIANHIGCSTKTVSRIRGELGLPAFDQSELEDVA